MTPVKVARPVSAVAVAVKEIGPPSEYKRYVPALFVTVNLVPLTETRGVEPSRYFFFGIKERSHQMTLLHYFH